MYPSSCSRVTIGANCTVAMCPIPLFANGQPIDSRWDSTFTSHHTKRISILTQIEMKIQLSSLAQHTHTHTCLA